MLRLVSYRSLQMPIETVRNMCLQLHMLPDNLDMGLILFGLVKNHTAQAGLIPLPANVHMFSQGPNKHVDTPVKANMGVRRPAWYCHLSAPHTRQIANYALSSHGPKCILAPWLALRGRWRQPQPDSSHDMEFLWLYQLWAWLVVAVACIHHAVENVMCCSNSPQSMHATRSCHWSCMPSLQPTLARSCSIDVLHCCLAINQLMIHLITQYACNEDLTYRWWNPAGWGAHGAQPRLPAQRQQAPLAAPAAASGKAASRQIVSSCRAPAAAPHRLPCSSQVGHS